MATIEELDEQWGECFGDIREELESLNAKITYLDTMLKKSLDKVVDALEKIEEHTNRASRR